MRFERLIPHSRIGNPQPIESGPDVFQKLHALQHVYGETPRPPVGQQFIERRQIRVRDVGQRPKFLLEPLQVHRTHSLQRLERNINPAPFLMSPIYDTHAAAAEFVQHGVAR